MTTRFEAKDLLRVWNRKGLILLKIAQQIFIVSSFDKLPPRTKLEYFEENPPHEGAPEDRDLVQEIMDWQENSIFQKWMKDNCNPDLLIEGLRPFDLEDENCLDIIGGECQVLGLLALTFSDRDLSIFDGTDGIQRGVEFFKRMEALCSHAIARGYGAMAFRVMKVELSIRGSRNVNPYSKKRLKKIEILKKELSKGDIKHYGEIPSEFLRRAQALTGNKERATQKMLKEILEEQKTT